MKKYYFLYTGEKLNWEKMMENFYPNFLNGKKLSTTFSAEILGRLFFSAFKKA
jgi:hypothetical protein